MATRLWLAIVLCTCSFGQSRTEPAVKKLGQWSYTCGSAPSHDHIDVLLDINEKGKPVAVRLENRTSGIPDGLANAVLHAVRAYRFVPATEKGLPVVERNYRLGWDLNCTQEDVDRHNRAMAENAAQAEIDRRESMYRAACNDPNFMTCYFGAKLRARGLPVPGDTSSGDQHVIPMLQTGSGVPPYLGPLGNPTSIISIDPTPNGAVFTLFDQSRWGLCLVNGGMSQNYSWWHVGDRVSVIAANQTYILVNQDNTAANLLALYLGR